MGISREAAKELTRLAWPSVLALVLDQATGLTTLFFVAALDDEYLLGSVGLGAMAQNVFGFSLGMGVNSALSTLVSQGNGAGRLDLCNLALQQAQLLSLLVAVPSMFIMLYTGAFFEAVGINQRSARDAGEYVRGTIFVMPFHFLSCATRLFLRAMKLPRPPSYVSLVVSLLHPIWCYLLLHRLGAGAFGAGLTVSISYGLYFALLTAYVAVVRPAPCDVAWTPLPLDLARRRLCSCMKRFNTDARAIEAEPGFREYLRVALPSAILMWTEWWVYEAMSLLAGLCGKTALAAHTATCSWLLIIFMVPSGLGSATSAAVGHAIGAGQSEAARSSMKAGVALILGSCSVLGLLLFLGRGLAGRLFSSDAEVLAAMNVLITILVVFQLFDGIQTVLEGGLIGLGLQRGASQVKLVSMVVVRLGGAYVLAIALHVGVSGIWIAGVLGMLVTATSMQAHVGDAELTSSSRRRKFYLVPRLLAYPGQSLEPVEDAFLQRYGGRLLGGAEAERSQDAADTTDSQNFTPILFANCLIIGLSAALGGYDHGAASGALQNLVALRGLKRQGRLGPLLQGWVVASAWASNIAGNLGGYYMPTPRLALIVAGFLEAIGSLLTALAPQLWVLILGRLINGFGLGLNGVAVSQYISEIAPPNARGGAIAVQETTFVSGAFIGALVGQHFLRLKDGWRLAGLRGLGSACRV
ncbi:DTX16 [Symbiodinium sp. CCMP2592]|nr:DTX16 [Symbiodinium sp. CCMP2592]